MWWEPYLLDLSKGFLISGLFLFTISVIFGAMHGFGQDHDLSGDHDISTDVDHDISVDHDIGVDHEVDADHDWDHTSVQGESSDTGTPLMLLASSFMLSFGFFGTTLYNIEINPYVRLLTILIVPILVTVMVSNIWMRIAKTQLGEIFDKSKVIGRIGVVVHQTGYRGGSIRVEIGEPLGVIQLPARTLKPNDEYLRGERVTIIEMDGNICVVEAQPMF